MKFEFDEPGIEAGFVHFWTNDYNSSLAVSRGRGRETITHSFHIQRPRVPGPYSEADQQQFCRVAIAASIKIGPHMAQGGTLQLTDACWNGTLVPYEWTP
ncbi:MAG: hypothetical protein V4724_26915 [Pseudomonadota bacterium]